MRRSLDWLPAALNRLSDDGLLRDLRTRGSKQTSRVVLDRTNYLSFASNDYLGLAADPRLAEAARGSIKAAGWGSGASPLVTGRSATHVELERRLAAFKHCEAALLFPSGFAANAGTIPALVGPSDYIFSDAANHASIIDGCRLSGATVVVYRHNDVEHLQQQLAATPTGPRRLIVTDSLFSMDGDLANLPVLAELSEQFGAMLMVDEAHATGVLGEGGRGACELLGVEQAVDVRMGTLSKALGSQGGFVAGCELLIRWLANRARSYVFSTAAPAATAAAARAALDVVREEPFRRTQLLDRAAQLRGVLHEQGWNLGQAAAQIVPVYVGDAQLTMDLAHQLHQQGFWVPGIRPPSVPSGRSLLRISLSFAHSPEQIEQLAHALAQLRSPARSDLR